MSPRRAAPDEWVKRANEPADLRRMPVIRALGQAAAASLLLVCLAPVTRADDYTWVDERGNAHITSDPTEIPVRYRKKALEDAEKAANKLMVVPQEKIQAQRNRYEKPRKPELTPEQKKIRQDYERLEREDRDARVNSQRYLARDKDAEDEARDAKRRERAEHEEETGVKNDTPEGFQRQCYRDQTSGEHCRFVEDSETSSQRYRDAYEKAMDDLGADEQQMARDPELKRAVEKRTQKNFDKSTPDPLHPASADDE